VKPTDVQDPEYFHKVVDCQWACPAHTPVPEYIRLIAEGKYTEAYMINWDSNVFPGILGRTCDRPCEPACRRGRVEEKPVAICRLKRVAADYKGDVKSLMPHGPFVSNGKKVALIGAGPASLTVARDLAPLGYEVHLFDEQYKGGGFMLSQIPAFRLPETVLDEEVAFQFLKEKESHWKMIKQHIGVNYSILEKWIANEYRLEWVKPGGGVVCFPRIKNADRFSTQKFYDLLLNKYGTLAGPGHWFEMPDHYMRIGYAWPKTDELVKGIEGISKALDESMLE